MRERIEAHKQTVVVGPSAVLAAAATVLATCDGNIHIVSAACASANAVGPGTQAFRARAL